MDAPVNYFSELLGINVNAAVEKKSGLSGECVLWPGAKSGNGYGVRSINGRNVYAHREAYENAYGSIPPKFVVAHKCDIPACVNPDHLFACTQRENLNDMKTKGRSAVGDKHRSKKHPELVLRGQAVGGSKLDETQVREIRAIYVKGHAGNPSPFSLAALARKYGVSFQQIHKIVRRKAWTHL